MADEPRRSGRATKGQHTKNLDLPDAAPTKRKSKGQAKAQKQSNEPTPAPSEESEEIIRCICGQYEEEEDVERDMICCDKCSAWQHNDCMGLTFAKGEEPAEYFCEQCKPENHQELLAKIARGEKPWEEAAKKRAQEAEEKKARRRKGKKGKKKGRPSDVKSEVSEEVSANVAAAPTHGAGGDEKKGTPADNTDGRRQSSQKRKFEPETSGTPEMKQKQKVQRLSTQNIQAAGQDRKSISPVQARKPGSISTLAPSRRGSKSEMSPTKIVEGVADIENAARRNVANAFIKLFVEQVTEAQKQGTYKLPEGQTKDAVGQRLGLGLEYALYRNLSGGRGEPSEAYKKQTRTILFNVKKNPSLRDRLLVGALSPDVLSMMTTEDMASKELRQKDAEIKREAEKQHIIVQEQGPRIRRTHKGEEFVEDDSQQASSEPMFSTAPGRRDTAPDIEGQSQKAGSPVSPGATRHQEFNEYRGPQDSSGHRRQSSSSNFNIQNVWSNVHSPGSAPSQDKPAFHAPSSYHEPPSTSKVQADADIDNLLKDEEIESPPYSPKDFHDDGTVWRGRMTMNPVADFTAYARHVGGADLSGRIPWNQLIPSALLIDGRIDIQLATNYLCGLRFSQSTDVSVVAVSPPDSPTDHAEFEKLFKYFSDRKRYGVIGKHPLPTVKDTYIVPVEAGSGKKPDFIELLENNTVQDPTPERLLLVVFVVKTNSNSTPNSQPTPQHQNTDPNSVMASPLTSIPTAQQQHQFPPQVDGAQPYSPPPAQPPQNLTGAAAAEKVLGPLAKSPAVEQLLQQAPNAEIAQLNVIAGILSHTPAAANDYQLLMNALVQTTNGSQS
ncbi:hypothetical protein FQN54_001412 [Arachnomyces sp. PD_36]|nr:hypothetical protein FQN54_001412 [Arachnomyces sp. PD_36]